MKLGMGAPMSRAERTYIRGGVGRRLRSKRLPRSCDGGLPVAEVGARISLRHGVVEDRFVGEERGDDVLRHRGIGLEEFNERFAAGALGHDEDIVIVVVRRLVRADQIERESCALGEREGDRSDIVNVGIDIFGRLGEIEIAFQAADVGENDAGVLGLEIAVIGNGRIHRRRFERTDVVAEHLGQIRINVELHLAMDGARSCDGDAEHGRHRQEAERGKKGAPDAKGQILRLHLSDTSLLMNTHFSASP